MAKDLWRLVGPALFAAALIARCAVADPNGDAPSRRAFSVSIDVGGELPDRPRTTTVQPAEPLWQPRAPAMLEPKGPPPFMPDDAGSHQVPAFAAPSTTTTTTLPPNGFMQAAMPLVSGMQSIVGQAEKMVHFPGAAKDQHQEAGSASTEP